LENKAKKLSFAGLKVIERDGSLKLFQPDENYFFFDLENIEVETWEKRGKRGARLSNGYQVLEGWILFPPGGVNSSNDIPEGMPKLVSLRDLNLMSNNFEKELLTEPKNQSLINAIYLTSKSIVEGAKKAGLNMTPKIESILKFMKIYVVDLV
tara:strand:- start:3021 stop:3479 length:459 start_codon:yes stop_codon:yes gene_type:complete